MNSTTSTLEEIQDIFSRFNNIIQFMQYYQKRMLDAGIDFPIISIPMLVKNMQLKVHKVHTKDSRFFVGPGINLTTMRKIHEPEYVDFARRANSLEKGTSTRKSKLKRDFCWFLPPLYFDLATGESGFYDGTAMFNFPRHPKEVSIDVCTIDDVYYFNSSRFAQYMLTLPDMDRVEQMEYQTEPMALFGESNLKRLTNFYKDSEQVVEASYKRRNPNMCNCINFLFPVVVGKFRFGGGRRVFTISRDRRILAVLVWSDFGGRINIPFIRVISRDKFDDELQPYLFHLILYEFCKRLPRDTEVVVAGSSSDSKTRERLKVLCYEDYKVIPSIPEAVLTLQDRNVRQSPKTIIEELDVHGYIPENYVIPYLYNIYVTFTQRSFGKPFFKLITRLSKGLNINGIVKRFRRFAIKHNARLVSRCYRNRTAKSYKHYIELPERKKRELGSARNALLVKGRKAAYGK